MAIGAYWAGRTFGTNIANVFVRIQGPDSDLHGILRVSDQDHGIAVLSLRGTFSEDRLEIHGVPELEPAEAPTGVLHAILHLQRDGSLKGEWSTSGGTGGIAVLFPHEAASAESAATSPISQLYTARHDFGAVSVARSDISEIAESLRSSPESGHVIVSVTGDTEQIRYLDDFKTAKFPFPTARVVRITSENTDATGQKTTIVVEFGQVVNFAMVQSSSEAWSIGKKEELKRIIKPHEKFYATHAKPLSIGINQLLLGWAIAFSPSLPSTYERVIYVGITGIIIYATAYLHRRYVPFASISLAEQPPNFFSTARPAAISWLIALSASTGAALLSAYLTKAVPWLSLAQ